MLKTNVCGTHAAALHLTWRVGSTLLALLLPTHLRAAMQGGAGGGCRGERAVGAAAMCEMVLPGAADSAFMVPVCAEKSAARST